jgi:hypothetical protein
MTKRELKRLQRAAEEIARLASLDGCGFAKEEAVSLEFLRDWLQWFRAEANAISDIVGKAEAKGEKLKRFAVSVMQTQNGEETGICRRISDTVTAKTPREALRRTVSHYRQCPGILRPFIDELPMVRRPYKGVTTFAFTYVKYLVETV